MAEVLVVGGLVFWLAMLVWVVILWALVENKHGFFGLLSIVAYGCILQFVFKVDVVNVVFLHPLPFVAFAAIYFFVGAGWSFWRWYLFVKDKLEVYTNMKTEWLISKGESQFVTIPDHLKDEWAKHIQDWRWREVLQTPLVRDHKSEIMRWIGWWPISAISWAFNDMIRRFVRIVYNSIHDWLQSIANNIFASVRKDLPEGFKYK